MMKKDNHNTMRSGRCAMMRIAPQQGTVRERRTDADGWPVPGTVSDADGATYALNVEPSADGGLSTACGALLVGSTALRPLFTDTALHPAMLYLSDSAGVLWRRKADDASAPTERVAHLGQEPAEACRCGEFIVVRLADGSLYYILIHADSGEAEALGTVPERVRIHAGKCGERIFEQKVAETAFAKAVGDMRGGVDEAVASRLRDAADRALERLVPSVAGAGYWMQNVCLRVALRLWNGSLLSVSDPVCVVNESPQSGLMPVFSLMRNSDGYCGASATSISCLGYRIAVTIMDLPSQAWAHLVKSVEIWASPETQEAGSYSHSAAGYSAESSAVRLSYPSSHRESLTGLALGEQRLVAVMSMEEATRLQILTRNESAKSGNPGSAAVAIPRLKAGAMESHDSFLHLGNVSVPLPRPSVGAEGGGATGCTVVAELRTPQGDLSVSRRFTMPGVFTGPLLWYPDSRAHRLTLQYLLADGSKMERSYELKPAPDGRDAALCEVGEAPVTVDEFTRFDTSRDSLRMPGRVMTMHRGNPLVQVSCTDCTDGEVKALCAQPCGGGAYTRQYLYVASEGRISAVIHDSGGVHRNCRTLAPLSACGPESLAATDSGVYLMSRNGELASVRDARVQVLVRSLTEYSRLGWYRERNQLWLMPKEGAAGKSLAIELSGLGEGLRGSLRSVVPGRILGSGGLQYTALSAGGVWRLYRMGGVPEPETGHLGALWSNSDVRSPAEGAALLGIEMKQNPGSSVRISLGGLNPWLDDASYTASPVPMVEGVSKSACNRCVQLPLVLPWRINGGEGVYTLKLEGNWESLYGWSIAGLKEWKGK